MKKIELNNEDYCFENKLTFKEKKEKIKNNSKKCIIGFLTGTIILSSGIIYKVEKDTKRLGNYYTIMDSVNKSEIDNNDKIIEELKNETILVTGVKSTIDTDYHIDNNALYDKDNNELSLSNITKPLYLVKCNFDTELLKKIELSSSKIKKICLDMTPITDDFVLYLPNTLTELSLYKCNYITSLTQLPFICPNISKLYLNNMPSLSDLSFIYNLPNLKEIYLSNNAYVNEELLTYLKTMNIRTNITSKDILNSQNIDNIIGTIIKPNMTDKEKIQAVSLYVINYLSYNIDKMDESNNNPLNIALDDKEGVCTSYAYLTNVLLNKAGITSFNIYDNNHSWNIIELDDAYYYLDTTKMDSSALYNFLLKTLNISKYYISDIDKLDDDTIVIPPSLVNDIISNKEIPKHKLISKNAIIIASILAGITIYIKTKKKESKEISKNK